MTRPAGAEADDPSPPVWTAAAVARRLGVSPATLRSWGARYGVGPPGHQAGRYRRYSSLDVAELDMMRRLHREGVPMATAASIARDRHRDTEHYRAETVSVTSKGPENLDDVSPDELSALIRAVRRLDADSAVRALQAGFTRRGVVSTWNQLCRPALTYTALNAEVPDVPGGTSGASLHPTASVDAECVLVWAITTSLHRLPAPPPAPPDIGHILLACTAGELHTLALDAVLAGLGEEHLSARTLGPSVPTPALVHAAETVRPAAVLLWSQAPATAHLDTLRVLLPHSSTVIAAGPGWTRDDLPAGVRTAHSLDEAIDHARRAATPRPASQRGR
ncbi:MerR family transcriptional regulator [Pseudonocardia sp. KRD-291]|nr:MerR family transcriptional regulator [Pseudonocardia sp. KRD291]